MSEKATAKPAEGVEAAKPAEAAKSSASGLRLPDAEGSKGTEVKAGELVRANVPGGLTDVLTLQVYHPGVWTEAVPSAWLDAQLKAGKVEVKR